ncbi:disulfide bond formation protein DsbB [Bibersteinia trehalosi Y31]|uniref:Disulfide bond formation protein B n=1 Tax=Bibersteinia trehalosi Y31 TaxID=1261658 RepID=A0A179D0E3_BIBTR|nr:disulfide bond formation protein DsbB [Bibersteinia trehalosi]OAQ15645.1 disulfide bond formation protein DsbB [Bibersteinia trehalosi Y31]
MFAWLKKRSLSRSTWLLCILSALALETAALYFQYGMGLQPCVMCIYERLALLAILAAGAIGIIAPRFFLIRWGALLLGLFGAIKGLMLAIKHTDYQLHPAPWNTCSPFLDFPPTLPLDKWLPSLFAASGDCSKISWEFLGLIMPQWLIVVFGIYCTILVLLTLAQFKRGVKVQRDLFH